MRLNESVSFINSIISWLHSQCRRILVVWAENGSFVARALAALGDRTGKTPRGRALTTGRVLLFSSALGRYNASECDAA